MPIDLSKDPTLRHKYTAAGNTLHAKNLLGQRVAVYQVIDVSGSMSPHFSSGDVQNFAEQALALSAHLDDDGRVPVVFFDSHPAEPADMYVTQAHGAIIRAMNGRRLGGGTSYATAMEKIIRAHRGNATPALVLFQTDGQDGNQQATIRLLCESANLPIFWQFIGFGPNNRLSPFDEFKFLRKLDKIRGRVVDNAGFFPAGQNPRGLTDLAMYDGILNEFPQWLTKARQAGVLR